jgi:hypothetical protein
LLLSSSDNKIRLRAGAIFLSAPHCSLEDVVMETMLGKFLVPAAMSLIFGAILLVVRAVLIRIISAWAKKPKPASTTLSSIH